MTARRFVRFTSLALLALCLGSSELLFAQLGSPDQTEIENSKYQFTGVVNSNAVYVRSGPSENDYPTVKLDKGAEVTVVGLKFEWLKVLPPEGSFCYVAKAFVDRHGNGSQGRVTSTLNVRVGSQLNELKAKIGTKLEPGANIEIIGEEQEYYKIRPPEGVFFYVNKQFVEPVRPVNLAQNDPQVPGPQEQAPTDPTDLPAETPMAEAPMDDAPVVTENPTTPVDANAGLAPAPSHTDLAQAPNARTTTPPATQPTADAEAEFDRLENAYAEATVKPLNEQPLTELLDGYQKLAASEGLPESLCRICDFKVEVLKNRMEVQQQFAQTQKHLDDMKHRQLALHAEQEELEERIKENDIHFFTAVGTLRPSSLQGGTETLYRLTDPSNGRTVVYVRTNDLKIAAKIGQFIGVRGEVQNDPRLNVRVITPSAFEEVNPAKVGQSIAAQIVPPSLLPGGTTARTE